MSDESHFIAEHIEQAAYLHVRGHSWAAVAHELKHHEPDRLRRTLRKDPAFKAELRTARAEFADECLAEGAMILRAQVRGDDKARALEAATKLIDFAEREKARQHAFELEQFKAAERARLQKDRIEAAEKLLDKRLAAQVRMETERAQMRTALGLGLPTTEKEKAKRHREMLETERDFYAANRRATAWMASAAARKEELVWLPGSDFGNGRAPDLNDKPFVLLSEPLDGKTIYWLCESHPTMMFPLGYKFLTNPDGSLVEDDPPGDAPSE